MLDTRTVLPYLGLLSHLLRRDGFTTRLGNRFLGYAISPDSCVSHYSFYIHTVG
jgi:hypothetical protein